MTIVKACFYTNPDFPSFKGPAGSVPGNGNQANVHPKNHLLEEAEEMVRGLVGAGILRKISTPTKFCASSNFIRKPSERGLCLISEFKPFNAYSESVSWPFWSMSELQCNILPDFKIFRILSNPIDRIVPASDVILGPVR